MRTDPVKVSISIMKANDGVKVTVDPFRVVIDIGEELEWELEHDYDDASATIKKKTNAHYPFDTAPPADIKKGAPKKSGKTKADPKKLNRYNIKCSVKNGTEKIEFVIDPDIIIIGGSLIPDSQGS